jgi:hypothetical protein
MCKEDPFLCTTLFDLKGTVSRDFLLLVFFMNQFPPSSRVFHFDRFKFFRKFTEIFAIQGAPPVSTTPVANFSTIFASVVDTGSKFSAGVNDTGSKFSTGINDTGGKFAAGVVDTGGK